MHKVNSPTDLNFSTCVRKCLFSSDSSWFYSFLLAVRRRPCWISVSIGTFLIFSFVQPVMNDTMEGRFPFCHNQNPAASPEWTCVLMVRFWRVGQVRDWTMLRTKAKEASKHDRNKSAVSVFVEKLAHEVTFEFWRFEVIGLLQFGFFLFCFTQDCRCI